MRENSDDTEKLIIEENKDQEQEKEVLKEYANHFTLDISFDEDNYNVGFLFCDNMAALRDTSEKEFLEVCGYIDNNPINWVKHIYNQNFWR